MKDSPKKAQRDYEQQLREMNDALLVSSVRQHELAEQAQKAEAALAESEEQLRRAFEEAPIPVIVHSEDGEVLQISRSWTKLTGYTIEDKSIFQTWLTRAYGYGGDDVLGAVKKLFESGDGIQPAEFDIVTVSGERRVWSFSASSPGVLRDGRRFIVGMAEDVTDRKRAERALRESEERLSQELAATERLQDISSQLIREDNIDALYDQILDAAIGIMRADMASMQILDEGEDALRLLAWRGFEPEFGKIFELKGRNAKTSCSLARQLGHRVVVPDVETDDFIAPTLEDYQKTGIRAIQSTPLFARDGQLVGMISTHWRKPHEPGEHELRLLDVLARQAADLVERSQAEEDLRKSEEWFHTMADKSPIMIWVTDPNGDVSFLNRTYLDYFGVTADEIPAYDWSAIAHPEDREAYAAAFRTALRDRKAFDQRVRLRGFDRQWRWFESRGAPLLNASGKLVAYIGSSLDITDIYESQQALKELGQRKDEFLANMSHEIRSPLTAIMGYTDVLSGKLQDSDDIECLKIIKESGDYLIEIVNDILDLSKIEAGKLTLKIEEVPVHAVLMEVQHLMDVRAREKKLPMSLRYEGALATVIQTDRTRLRQILINLVSNAIKFTERGQIEIIVRFVAEDSLLQIEVIDSGIGISAEDQKILFQPFSQGDTSSTRQYGGSGLGLAITRRLVEMLGGSISFESELGKGSTFRVQVPVGMARTVSKVTQFETVNDDFPLKNRRILVVDDRQDIRYLVSRYIKDAGGRPATAVNGETAIEAVAAAGTADPFHVIILDIQMPGMDGNKVARTLRASGCRTPIIALTAGAMEGDREKCLQAGCDDYLTKPIDRRKLVQVVAEYAHRGSKLRILLVDDSYNTGKLLSIFLEKRGHEVRSVYDGESALLLAPKFRPDLILLDIALPDMNGCEAMERLKASGSFDGVRFVALSGHRAIDVPGSAQFDDFLEKPLDTARLEIVLESIANDRSQTEL